LTIIIIPNILEYSNAAESLITLSRTRKAPSKYPGEALSRDINGRYGSCTEMGSSPLGLKRTKSRGYDNDDLLMDVSDSLFLREGVEEIRTSNAISGVLSMENERMEDQ
jgi:hypothetical protein